MNAILPTHFIRWFNSRAPFTYDFVDGAIVLCLDCLTVAGVYIENSGVVFVISTDTVVCRGTFHETGIRLHDRESYLAFMQFIKATQGKFDNSL
jgi:hypothetical protein